MLQNGWVDINKIVELFHVSENTVRRWIIKHKKDKFFVRKDKNKYLININYFSKSYKATHQNYSTSSSDEYFSSKEDDIKNNQKFINNDNEKLALMTISKQANDISQALLQQNKHNIYRHSSFWILVILIILILIAGYYYKNELTTNHLKDLAHHTTRISCLSERLQKTESRYHSALARIDTLHADYNDKLEDKEKTHKAELAQEREKLQQLQHELSKKSQPQSFGTTE